MSDATEDLEQDMERHEWRREQWPDEDDSDTADSADAARTVATMFAQPGTLADTGEVAA